ncbi:TetR family transcriptional regulator [Brevibacillus daliensis]|uniref:TetR family transcriptional regulator n=1 Tax=Brevibacillus daliensis TaxID=2892995 RepID=UPI001E6199AC|nr:TetR family transcriptional regulator [Brevibacillus daliensis]
MSPKVSEAYKKEKKIDLLRAAKRVFINKGYTHATMQDVMDESGMSRGGLYSYFNHIDHLFMEVLQFEDQEDILFFEPSDEYPLWTQLTEWLRLQQKNIEGINNSLVRAKAEFFLTSNYARDKENYPYITERYDNIKNAIKGFIQKGIKQGEFQPILDPEHIVLYFISFIDGLMLDTFQLGSQKTDVKVQLTAFQFSLKAMLLPVGEK